jgi:hypothetical protein
MTRTITFEGASDDLVYVNDDGDVEEYQAYDGAQFHLVSSAGQMQVTVKVDDASGCWTPAPGQTSEAFHAPGWPIKLDQAPDCEYSARLTVEAPSDTEVHVK